MHRGYREQQRRAGDAIAGRRRPRDMVRRRPRDTVKLRPGIRSSPSPGYGQAPAPGYGQGSGPGIRSSPSPGIRSSSSPGYGQAPTPDTAKSRSRDTAKSRSRDIRVKVTHLAPRHMRSARTDGREARSLRLQPRNSAPGQDSPVEERGFEPTVPLRGGCFQSSNASGLGTSRTASASERDRGFESSFSSGESVLTSAQPHNRLRTPRLGGGLRVGWDVRRGPGGREPVLLGPFLCRALMQSHFGRAIRTTSGRVGAAARQRIVASG